jgi:hypothetical protein
MYLPTTFLVPLLLNYHRLKSLDQTPPRDHDSVFKWLWRWKPLDSPEFAWINHPEDFVSLVPPRRSGFENFILRHLDNWPRSAFTVRISLYKSTNTDQPPPLLVLLHTRRAAAPNTRLISSLLLHITHHHLRSPHGRFLRCTSPLHPRNSVLVDFDE